MKIRKLDYPTYCALQNEENVISYLNETFEKDIVQKQYDGSFMTALCTVTRARTFGSIDRIAKNASISTGSFNRMERGKQGNATIRSIANLLAVGGLTLEFKTIVKDESFECD